MLGIGPESFYAIEVISALGRTFVFADHHMVPPDRQEGIGIPVIGVVETSWFRVVGDEWDQAVSSSGGNWKGHYPPIPLVDAKDHVFP